MDKIEKIYTQFDNSHFYEPPSINCTLPKEFYEITEDQLIELLKDMNQTTRQLDPCSSKLVYKSLEVLKVALTKMVNLSHTRSIYSGLETSNSQAFNKKINLGTKFKNYRSISNLSLVSKIVEEVVQNQLTDHFIRQLLIPTHQNTYRKFYSIKTTILDLCDSILINMENNENTTVVTLDLSACSL